MFVEIYIYIYILMHIDSYIYMDIICAYIINAYAY